MSEVVSTAASALPPRAGRTESGRRKLRGALALAALDLFVEQGYEATTVDQIAEAVGVGRRTFFRYYRSKEDVVFPGHDDRVAGVVERLDAADPAEHALTAVGATAQFVLEMYLAEPELAMRRFELTRQVPSLRDKEIASIDRYQRAFARFLRRRWSDRPDGDLWAAMTASAVVAAHNQVLREWLRSGGDFDAVVRLRRALNLVHDSLGQPPAGQPTGSEVVITVVRTTASPERVRERIESALRET